MSDNIRYTTVTIANNASLSDAADLTGVGKVCAIITDAAWDTQAVTFQVSIDGTTYFNLSQFQTIAEYALAAVTASAYVPVDMALFYGARKVKVRSGTAGAAANQTSATVVTLAILQV